jgi:hypothetical protein
MTDGKIIEGNTENSGFSDLSLAIGCAGRWTNIPDGDYLFGGSGATLRAVSLRKPAIEKEARLRSQQFYFRGAGRPACKCETTTVRGDCGSSQPAPLDFL